MKKALCVFIVLLLIASCFSFAASAVEIGYTFRGKLTDARSLTEEEAEILRKAVPSESEFIVKICFTDLWPAFGADLPVEDITQISPSNMMYFFNVNMSTHESSLQVLSNYVIRFDEKIGYQCVYTEGFEFFTERIDHVDALLKNNGVEAAIKAVYCLEGGYGEVMIYFVTEQGDYILYNPCFWSSAREGEPPAVSKEYFFPVEVMYELADAWQAKVDAARERAKETGFNVSWGGEITELKDLSAYVAAPETWVLASTEKEGTDPSENTDVSTETGTDASVAQTEKTTGAAEDGSKTGWIVAAVCAGVVVIAVIAAVLLRKKKD